MDDVASLPGTRTDDAVVNLVLPLLPADESKQKQRRNSMDDLRGMVFNSVTES